MLNVFPLRNPFQVVSPVVQLVAVYMVHHIVVLSSWDKVISYQLMNVASSFFPGFTCSPWLFNSHSVLGVTGIGVLDVGDQATATAVGPMYPVEPSDVADFVRIEPNPFHGLP